MTTTVRLSSISRATTLVALALVMAIGFAIPAVQAQSAAECAATAEFQLRGLRGQPYYLNSDLEGVPAGFFENNPNTDQKWFICDVAPNGAIQVTLGNVLVWTASTGNSAPRDAADDEFVVITPVTGPTEEAAEETTEEAAEEPSVTELELIALLLQRPNVYASGQECAANADFQLRGLNADPWYLNEGLLGTPEGFFPEAISDQKWFICDFSEEYGSVQIAYGDAQVWVANTGDIAPRAAADGQ